MRSYFYEKTWKSYLSKLSNFIVRQTVRTEQGGTGVVNYFTNLISSPYEMNAFTLDAAPYQVSSPFDPGSHVRYRLFPNGETWNAKLRCPLCKVRHAWHEAKSKFFFSPSVYCLCNAQHPPFPGYLGNSFRNAEVFHRTQVAGVFCVELVQFRNTFSLFV